MPARKTGAVKRTTEKKTGQAARAKRGVVATMPRSAKQWAALINEKEKRRPGWFREVMGHLKFTTAPEPERFAQAFPRDSSATH